MRVGFQTVKLFWSGEGANFVGGPRKITETAVVHFAQAAGATAHLADTPPQDFAAVNFVANARSKIEHLQDPAQNPTTARVNLTPVASRPELTATPHPTPFYLANLFTRY